MNTNRHECGVAEIARPLNSKMDRSVQATERHERRSTSPDAAAERSGEYLLAPGQRKNWNDWFVPQAYWRAPSRVRFDCETVFPMAQFSPVSAESEADQLCPNAELVRVNSRPLVAAIA